MLFVDNNQVWESFIYVPKKPVAINSDGSWNMAVVSDLILKAKAGDNEAQMLLFEQYQYLWKKKITKFVDDMLSYEDAQQEAFYIFLYSLKSFKSDTVTAFTGYYEKALHNHLTRLTGKVKDEQRLWLFSLDESNEDGSRKHDIEEQEYMDNEVWIYPRVRRVLDFMEFRIIIAHYVFDLKLSEIARVVGYSLPSVKRICARAKERLKIFAK